MKRKIVRGLLAGLLAVSLWGCGKDKTDEAAQQESVTVAEEEESEADVADDSGAEGETVDGADERGGGCGGRSGERRGD